MASQGHEKEGGSELETEEKVGDVPDAKGFFGRIDKLLCGTSKALKSMYLDENVDEEVYRRVPKITREELMSDVYKMDFPRRGRAILINNKNFSTDLQKKGFGVRTGTDIDATKIGRRLAFLGFEVERYHDMTCKEILRVFQEEAKKDHSDADCFAAVLLSHGEQDNIYGIDGKVEIKELLKCFTGENCPTLIAKPKLFFIQACRGNQLDAGVGQTVIDAKRCFTDAFPPEEEIRIPNEADILVSYSTVPGYYAWRNSTNGSWFMQALVSMIDKFGTVMELQKLLTRVHREVAYNFKSSATMAGMNNMKQVPSFTSMLTKDLYFIPKDK